MQSVLINGFGRIGRVIMRQYMQKLQHAAPSNYKITAINIGAGDIANTLHLLKYDSVLGVCNHFEQTAADIILRNGQEVKIYNTYTMQPAIDAKPDIILECTGKHMAKEPWQEVLNISPNTRILLAAPAKGSIDRTIIYGVNHNTISQKDQVISIGSCTTNCAAPIVDVLDSRYGISGGFITTVHSYTSDQQLLDAKHKDPRRARSAALSMIPTSSGVSKALSLIFPHLLGKIDGAAIRVPTPNVSLIDCVFRLNQDVSADNANNVLHKSCSNVLGYTTEPLVSCDYIGNTHSAVVDSLETKQIASDTIRLLAWYDNETGFSCRMLDVVEYITAL